MFEYTYFISFVYQTTTGPAFDNLSVDLPQRLNSLDSVRDLQRGLSRTGYPNVRVLGFTLLHKTEVTS